MARVTSCELCGVAIRPPSFPCAELLGFPRNEVAGITALGFGRLGCSRQLLTTMLHSPIRRLRCPKSAGQPPPRMAEARRVTRARSCTFEMHFSGLILASPAFLLPSAGPCRLLLYAPTTHRTRVCTVIISPSPCWPAFFASAGAAGSHTQPSA